MHPITENSRISCCNSGCALLHVAATVTSSRRLLADLSKDGSASLHKPWC